MTELETKLAEALLGMVDKCTCSDLPPLPWCSQCDFAMEALAAYDAAKAKEESK